MKVVPSEPAPAPPKGYRPHMPMKVKLEAALRALGLTLETVDFDHTPPLQMRVWRPDKGDTDPPANDPAFIMPSSAPITARRQAAEPRKRSRRAMSTR